MTNHPANVNKNQILFDILISQRNDLATALAVAQADLSVAQATITDLSMRLSEKAAAQQDEQHRRPQPEPC